LHGLLHHRQQLAGEGVHVHLLAQAGAERLDRLGGVVAAAVEAAVDRLLDAAATTRASTPVTAAANANQRSCRRSVPRARRKRSTSDQAPTARPPAVTANAAAVARFATPASAGTASGLGIDS
jgi:hypothetical protein